MNPVEIVAVIVGAIGVVWFVSSAVRTVLMPRPERVWLTATAFDLARSLAFSRARRIDDVHGRNRTIGTFAPAVLGLLPALWSIGIITSFTAIYWGLDVGTWVECMELSGSSFTTLGFVGAPTGAPRLLAIGQGLLGIAVVTLMISFLPTIYGAFSRREIAVLRLTARADDPPDPVRFIGRLHEIDRLHLIGERWAIWEDWFAELSETHTTFPALIYFRSSHGDHSWLASADVVLDTAALLRATELAPQTGQADTMIRSGYLAVADIERFFEPDGQSATSEVGDLSVRRSDFDLLLEALHDEGIAFSGDPDRAWEAFRGWRVNYDRALVVLAERILDEPSHWERRRSAGAKD